MSNFIKEWTQKEVEVLNKSFRRYSVFVFILKFILPVVVIVMAGILFFYPMLSGHHAKKIELVAKQEVASTANPVMVNPKFNGLDSKGQPYQVRAKSATQQTPTFSTLDQITADQTLNDGKWVSLSANSGTYDSEKHFLHLTGDVNVFVVDENDQSYQATGSEADIDIDKGIISSNEPIEMHSENGNFTAKSFTAYRDDQRINFKGPVNLIILKTK